MLGGFGDTKDRKGRSNQPGKDARPLTPEELEQELTAHHADAFGWALNCCEGDEQEAEDVLQSTYVKVLAGRARYGAQAAFRTWLFGVIRFTALEHRRRQRSHAARAERLAAEPDPPAGVEAPDTRVIRAEEAERLRGLLSQLPERQREVLHLAFYQGLSLTEAAQVMEISLGSVRTHYHRGKERLRALLQDGHP